MSDDSGRTTATRNWRHRARCRDHDPDTLFVQGARQRDVREVCKACPVRTECLAHALDNRIRFGVWGGMTERERRALLKRRPDVVSWSALLEAARRAALRPQEPAAETPPRAGRQLRVSGAPRRAGRTQADGTTAAWAERLPRRVVAEVGAGGVAGLTCARRAHSDAVGARS